MLLPQKLSWRGAGALEAGLNLQANLLHALGAAGANPPCGPKLLHELACFYLSQTAGAGKAMTQV